MGLRDVIDGAQTLSAGRARFFLASGFALDGGYDEPWAEASFGPVRYAVPNVRARASALRVHDLHHVLTGYAADWRGESEISAWELASGGGGRFAYAWFIALFGLFVGLLASPLSMWRAFARGARSRNLFSDPDPARWLATPVDDIRAALTIDRVTASARVVDRIRFAAWSLLALALGVLFVLGSPALVVIFAFRRGCPFHALARG